MLSNIALPSDREHAATISFVVFFFINIQYEAVRWLAHSYFLACSSRKEHIENPEKREP